MQKAVCRPAGRTSLLLVQAALMAAFAASALGAQDVAPLGTPVPELYIQGLVPPDDGNPPRSPPKWEEPKKMAVILISLTGAPYLPVGTDPGPARNAIRKQVFTNSDSTNAFWQDMSYGEFSISGHLNVDGDVFGPVPINFPTTPCDRQFWALAAQTELEAQGIGFSADNYDLIAYSTKGPCPSKGEPTLDPPGAFMGNFSLRATTHEMGHALGLAHSSSLCCQGPSLTDDCSRLEYGDLFDVMGLRGSMGYNQQKRGQAGWLEESDTIHVDPNGGTQSFTLDPLGLASSATKVLRLPRVDGPFGREQFYYVEFRQPSVFDNFMLSEPIALGTTIRLGPGYNRLGRTYLVDSEPRTGSLVDAPFVPVGPVPAVYVDPSTGTTISTTRVVQVGGSGPGFAEVTITPGAILPCAYGDPVLTLTPGSLQVVAGQAVPYTLTLLNGDSQHCPWRPISVTVEGVPTSWGSEAVFGFEQSLQGAELLELSRLIVLPVTADPGFATLTFKALNKYTGRSTEETLVVQVLGAP